MRTRFPRPMLALLATLLAGAPAMARAQTPITGGIAGIATIMNATMNTVGYEPLDFGTLIPGASATILPQGVGSGEFRVTGTLNQPSVDFILFTPTTLAGPGGASIPISFNGNFAASCELNNANVCQTATVETWNPSTTFIRHDTPSGGANYTRNTLAIYLGGTVTPALTQAVGHYTGTVTLLLVIN